MTILDPILQILMEFADVLQVVLKVALWEMTATSCGGCVRGGRGGSCGRFTVAKGWFLVKGHWM